MLHNKITHSQRYISRRLVSQPLNHRRKESDFEKLFVMRDKNMKLKSLTSWETNREESERESGRI